MNTTLNKPTEAFLGFILGEQNNARRARKFVCPPKKNLAPQAELNSGTDKRGGIKRKSEKHLLIEKRDKDTN